MKIIGLTGSIGMGKSTAAAMLRRLRVPVHCSDEAVHRLLGRGGAAVTAVTTLFPNVLDKGVINRQKLGAVVFADEAALKRLEHILHPLVRMEERKFLNRARRAQKKMVVLDIPLLFETGRAQQMDAVWVVSAPVFVQRARVLKRPGMSEKKFNAILKKQMPDPEKRKRGDVIIPTGLGAALTFARLRHQCRQAIQTPACVRPH